VDQSSNYWHSLWNLRHLSSKTYEIQDFRTLEHFTSTPPQHPKPLISEHFHVTFGDVIMSCHFDAMKLQKVIPFIPYEPSFQSVKSLDFTTGCACPLGPMASILGLRYQIVRSLNNFQIVGTCIHGLEQPVFHPTIILRLTRNPLVKLWFGLRDHLGELTPVQVGSCWPSTKFWRTLVVFDHFWDFDRLVKDGAPRRSRDREISPPFWDFWV
jgi:hypothetical protein